MADLFPGVSAQSTTSIFNFGNHAVRIIVRDDEPWFVAADVAAALGYRDAQDAGRSLKPEQKADTQIVRTSSNGTEQARRVTVINESGLYRLVLRSRKPEAEKFSDWVTGEVLPAIRKTGRYEKPGHEMTVNEMVEKMTRQVSEPNGHPALLFMPLVEAVQRKLGKRAVPPVPAADAPAIDATDAPAMVAARKVALDYFDAYREAVKSGKGWVEMDEPSPDILNGILAHALMNQRMLISFNHLGKMQCTLLPGDASVVSFSKDGYSDVVQRIPMERIPDMLTELSKRVGCHLGAFSEHLQRNRAAFKETAPGALTRIHQ